MVPLNIFLRLSLIFQVFTVGILLTSSFLEFVENVKERCGCETRWRMDERLFKAFDRGTVIGIKLDKTFY